MVERGRFTNPLLRCRRRSAAAIPSGVAGGEMSNPALIPRMLPLLAPVCRPDAVWRLGKGRVATGALTSVGSFGTCTPLRPSRPLRPPVGLVVGPMSSTEVGDVGLNGSSVLSSWAPSSMSLALSLAWALALLALALLAWALSTASRPALGGGSAE